MKTAHRHSLESIRISLATVRSTIERNFALLLEQQPRVFRLALNEAEAIAWETEFPHLVYPALAEEKVNGVAKWYARQRSVRRNEPTLAFAA